jgi:DNA-binding NarL/FixJ family response regulator
LTRSSDPSSCRIGLRGDTAFVDRARSAVDGSGIEVASIGSDGNQGNAGEELDALIVWSPDRGAHAISDLEVLCAAKACPVIIVTDSIDRGGTLAMLRAGVRGIVISEELESALAPTVRAIRTGQVAIPRPARHQIFRPVLSHRENTVLAMVAQGRSNSQIAAQLHVEESTVKSHLRSLFAKLGVSSREEAAAAVFDGNSQVVSGVMAVTAEHQRSNKPSKAPPPSAPSKRPVTS